MSRGHRLWIAVGIALLALAGTLLLGGLDLARWSWRTVSGQTVPRTPPPTFTPTPSATLPITPTDTPPPTATATLAPGAPTPVPRPNPVISLNARPQTIGPGDVVTFTCRLANHGNAAAEQVQMSLPILWPLAVQSAVSSAGTVGFDVQGLSFALDALQPEQEVAITVRAVVQEDTSPDQTLVYRAQLVFREGERESNEVQVILPPALLPATGG